MCIGHMFVGTCICVSTAQHTIPRTCDPIHIVKLHMTDGVPMSPCGLHNGVAHACCAQAYRLWTTNLP